MLCSLLFTWFGRSSSCWGGENKCRKSSVRCSRVHAQRGATVLDNVYRVVIWILFWLVYAVWLKMKWWVSRSVCPCLLRNPFDFGRYLIVLCRGCIDKLNVSNIPDEKFGVPQFRHSQLNVGCPDSVNDVHLWLCGHVCIDRRCGTISGNCRSRPSCPPTWQPCHTHYIIMAHGMMGTLVTGQFFVLWQYWHIMSQEASIT